MTKTRDLANLIADSKVGPSEIDTTGTYQVNSLGVGKAASVKLDVAGDIASSTKLHVTIGANTPVIRLTNTINSGGNIDMYSYSDGAFYINNAAGTGIGMLANKDVYVGRNFSVGDSALSTYHANYPAIDIGSSASVQGFTGNNGVWLQSNLFMNTNGQWTSKSDDYSAMIELYDGNINFYNTASGTGTRTLLTPMTIRQSGNVGIGEPSPNQPLVVKNTTDGAVIVANTAQAGGQGIGFFTDTANNRVGVFNNSSSTLDMVFNTGGTATSGEAMRIDNANKNVAIGTTNTNRKLVVKGTVGLEATNSTNQWALYNYTDNTLRINYNGAGADEVTIDTGGRVGIGKVPASSTGSMLQIEGNDGIAFRRPNQTNHFVLRPLSASGGDGMRFTQEGVGDRMFITSGGNVGIGIDPQVLLHVQAGSTGNGTVRIGGGAGLQISHDNSANTVQTIESLYRTTSASANLQIKTGHLKVFTGTSGAEAVKIDTTETVWNGGNQSYNDNYRVYAHVENVSSLFNNTTNGQTQTITVNNHLPYQHVLPIVVAFTYGGNGAISYSKTLLVENGFNNIMIEQLATNDSDGGSILASVGFNATGSYNNRRLQITATPGSSYSMNQWNCSVYYGAAWH